MGSCYSLMGKRRGDEKGMSLASATSVLAASPSKRYKWKRKSSGVDDVDHESLLLSQIEGRTFMNGATKIACLYTQQGKKGTNQDAMIVWENFSPNTDATFCGVFDGHGPFGHMVAKKVRDSLPVILSTQWATSPSDEESSINKTEGAHENTNGEETTSVCMDDELVDALEVEENEKVPGTLLPLKKSVLKAFKLMDKELKLHPTIDCFCSGTTAVNLIKQGQDLVIANVGDSRAVLATRDKDDSLLAVQLTVDLKPDLPREAARIQRCKGRVFALQDEPEVARVWLPNNDSPGLAMARAFGDFCLKDFGLISVPDVYYHRLTERDEFIILATDGVWDVLSNKEAIDVVASAPGRATAARALVESAVRAWRFKYPTSKTDDCAVVCLFLEHLTVVNGVKDGYVETIAKESEENMTEVDDARDQEIHDDNHFSEFKHSRTIPSSDEIVHVSEEVEEKFSVKSHGQSRRSLAECISATEEEEWSALEGITRVNSLLSLPRLLSSDSRRSASWRKWL